MTFFLRALCLAGLLGVSAVARAGDFLAVPPSDPHLRYVGRFDAGDPAGPRCAWSASAVTIRFQGTDLDVEMTERGADVWQVVVDGKPGDVLTPKAGAGVYPVAHGLSPGEHVAVLAKRTEANIGTTQITGFRLAPGSVLLDPPAPAHRIEVIGDSISCGYGNEAAGKEQHFSPATENGCAAYGALAAQKLGADYVCIAWSGRTMWPDNTVSSVYDSTLPGVPASTWDFSRWTPDVVLINLATNDFRKGNPDRAGWTGAYVDFVRKVRGHYPHATIYLATGSMMSDLWPPGVKALSTVKEYLAQVVNDLGDANVRRIDFPTQSPDDGYGADWHPSLATDRKMGDQFAAAVAADLGWPLVPISAPASP